MERPGPHSGPMRTDAAEPKEMPVRKEEATQLAMGYAWGREDASGTPTVTAGPGGNGARQFSEAFAQGQDDFNSEKRYNMTPVREAYEAWQLTNGRTIFARDVPERVPDRN